MHTVWLWTECVGNTPLCLGKTRTLFQSVSGIFYNSPRISCAPSTTRPRMQSPRENTFVIKRMLRKPYDMRCLHYSGHIVQVHLGLLLVLHLFLILYFSVFNKNAPKGRSQIPVSPYAPLKTTWKNLSIYRIYDFHWTPTFQCNIFLTIRSAKNIKI